MKYKILVLGDYGTGKTSVFNLFQDAIPGAEKKPSIKLDLIEFTRTIKGEEITVELYDIPGKELSNERRTKHYQGANGAFIVFDITSPHSFRHAPFWIEELMNYNGYGKVPIVLLGNKADLRETSERVLNPIDAQEFIFRMNRTTRKENVDSFYFELSAKNAKGILPIIDSLIQAIYRHQKSLKK